MAGPITEVPLVIHSHVVTENKYQSLAPLYFGTLTELVLHSFRLQFLWTVLRLIKSGF